MPQTAFILYLSTSGLTDDRAFLNSTILSFSIFLPSNHLTTTFGTRLLNKIFNGATLNNIFGILHGLSINEATNITDTKFSGFREAMLYAILPENDSPNKI